jgi:endonuclease YncB( thermonuclease family)
MIALGGLVPRLAGAQVEPMPRIVDGATLAVAGREFRLHGIVAPALDQVCQRLGRPYQCGQVARAALWDLIGGREVTCTPVAAAGARAPEPATCSAGETKLNEAMLESGWVLADPAAGKAYVALGRAAERAGRGLWSGEFELAGTTHPASR